MGRLSRLGVCITLIAAAVARADWKSDFWTVTAFGDRLAGSPGEAATLAWAAKRLAALGFSEVQHTSFAVTVPDDRSKGVLHAGSDVLEVDPLWPNLVSPSTVSLNGAKLVDGRAVEGHPLAGSIVALPFGSGDAWKRMATKGVAAFVFWDDGRITRSEAEQKVLGTPVAVPRFMYFGRPERLFALFGQATMLRCRQPWVVRNSGFVEAVLPGSSGDEILIGASADSMSVVPGRAPGAEGAIGLAALMDVCRDLAARRPPHTVRVVVFGANALAMRGTREYVARWGSRPPVRAGLTFDLSSGHDRLGLFARGWLVDARDESKDIASPLARFLREAAPDVIEDTVNGSAGTPWKAAIPGKFAFACEPFILAQVPVLTIATLQDVRSRVDTPNDLAANVDLDAVAIQIAAARNAARRMAEDLSRRRAYRPRLLSLVGGFGTVRGRVVAHEPQKSLIPNTPVEGALAVLLGRQPTMMGVRGDLIDSVGADGRFEFRGVPLVNTYLEQDQSATQVAAFRVGGRGKIDRAPASGVMGSDDYPTRFFLKTTERDSPLVVAPARSSEYLGIRDPRDARPLRFDILDAATLGTPNRSSVFQRADPKGELADEAVVFTDSWGQVRSRSADASPSQASSNRGLLHVLGRNRFGELAFLDLARHADGLVPDPALASAVSLSQANGERIDRFEPLRLTPAALKTMHGTAMQHTLASQRARDRYAWAEADREASRAWGTALRAYPLGRKVAADLLAGVLVYLVLLIPFSVFVERMVVHANTLGKQAAWTLAVFLCSYAGLGFLHPAFLLIPNPWIVFIAFVMAGLSAFVAAYLMAKFDRDLKAASTAQHANLERLGVLATSLVLGLTGMRRRRLRSGLTASTLAILTVVALAFTSLVPEVEVRSLPAGRVASYDGVLARLPDLGAVPDALARMLSQELGSTSYRRVTLDAGEGVEVGAFEAVGPAGRTKVRALLGLDRGDPLAATAKLVEGQWPTAGEVALPQEVARLTGAKVGDTLRLLGLVRKVSGRYDPKEIHALQDLDGDGLMPPDFSLSRRVREKSGSGTSAFLNIARVDAGSCLVLPAGDVLDLGGTLRSVAVAGPVDVRPLMERLRLNLYAGSAGSEVVQFSALPSVQGKGHAEVLVLMVIALLFVFNAMVASVLERKKEMATLAALGMAPHHLAAMFVAEAVVLAVLGSVSGYFIAQGGTQAMRAVGLLPDLRLDLSSASATLTVVLVFLVAVGGATYPAMVAARQGRPPSRDDEVHLEGDVAQVRLPFWIPAAQQASFCAAMHRYLDDHQTPGAGGFLSESTSVANDQVEALVHLVPFDAGILQRVVLACDPADEGRVVVRLERLAGEQALWRRFSRPFLRALRGQVLAWRE